MVDGCRRCGRSVEEDAAQGRQARLVGQREARLQRVRQLDLAAKAHDRDAAGAAGEEAAWCGSASMRGERGGLVGVGSAPRGERRGVKRDIDRRHEGSVLVLGSPLLVLVGRRN